MSDLAWLRAGGKPALARALALIETAPDAAEVTALLDAALAAPRGRVIGLTGPPGVGKSTLLDAVVRTLRARSLTVGVIAVDPSSRLSGGALLGDRTRVSRDPGDDGVFMRSMAARDRLGGLADLVFPASVLMRAVKDIVLVETVGVGQSETAIAEIADWVVFCAQPGSGDALQFMKAGVMEIPDLILVTKSDMGAVAQQTVADLRGALGLARPDRPPAILACSARFGEGMEAVADALADVPQDPMRRARQTRSWLERSLRDRFGSEGMNRVSGSLAGWNGADAFTMAYTIGVRLAAALDRLE
ncbi:MAG: methylmalonyl Co-A mutase-associated GTPase MeaB [Pseudomonadota bacterium]